MTVGIEHLVALVLAFLFHLRNLPYIFVNSNVPCMHEILPLLGRFHAPLVSLPTGRDAFTAVPTIITKQVAICINWPIIMLNFLHFLLVVAVPEEQLCFLQVW